MKLQAMLEKGGTSPLALAGSPGDVGALADQRHDEVLRPPDARCPEGCSGSHGCRFRDRHGLEM